jgi:hypothetical protein
MAEQCLQQIFSLLHSPQPSPADLAIPAGITRR